MNRRSKGFTLLELLCTVLIMLLVSLCVNVGIRLAVESYSKSLAQSEAQILCATVSDLVCDELRFSSSLEWEEGTLYFSDSRGVANRRFQVNENGQVLLGYRPGSVPEPERLLPERAYPNGLRTRLEIQPGGTTSRLTIIVAIVDRDQRTLAERSTEIEVLKLIPDP